MRVAVIGAGPAGLLLGSTLAMRGHDVVAVERDPGPPREGRWRRRGVMQFHHAHAFRTQVAEVLQQEWPDAFDAWVALGAEPVTMDIPGAGVVLAGYRSRRETFERALRAAAQGISGLSIRHGHVDAVLTSRGRVSGVVVDHLPLEADLVVDASGRAGRAVDGVRERLVVGGICGIAYVDRQYQLRPDAEPGPMINPLAWQGEFDHYAAVVFLHERGHFSVLLVRPTDDPALKDLRHEAAFEAACRAIPGLADWTDPARATPTTGVLPGGQLRNTYVQQGGADGMAVVPGLVSVGDCVATTTPTFGRGVVTTFQQVQALLRLLDDGVDPALVAEPFGQWCDQNILPWVVDQMDIDADQIRRWKGEDVDLSTHLPSNLILVAGTQDRRITEGSVNYLGMQEMPAGLQKMEPLAQAVYRSGWRPPYSPGPNRDELVEIVRAAAPSG